MLTIHGGMEFPAEQIFEGNHLHGGVTELVFYGGGYGAFLWIVNNAPRDRRRRGWR